MASSTSRNHLNRESSSTPGTWRLLTLESLVDAHVSTLKKQTEAIAVSGAQSAGDRADAAGSLHLATRQVRAART